VPAGGAGIRVLLRGRFRVETAGPTIVVEPGEPWFERGPDPVYAESIADEPTRARPKSQTYTVFVDAPLAL